GDVPADARSRRRPGRDAAQHPRDLPARRTRAATLRAPAIRSRVASLPRVGGRSVPRILSFGAPPGATERVSLLPVLISMELSAAQYLRWIAGCVGGMTLAVVLMNVVVDPFDRHELLPDLPLPKQEISYAINRP